MTHEDHSTPDEALAEIYDDLRRRRTSGEIPAELEDEIVGAFARIAPESAWGGDVEVLLVEAEESASIDPHVPVEGGGPVAVVVRRLLRKSMYWYVSFVTRQVGHFAGNLSRATRLLERRLRRLEEGQRATPRVDAELARLEPGVAPEAHVEAVREAIAGAGGTVLVTDAGRDDLLEQLSGSLDGLVGVDANPAAVVRLRSGGVQAVLADPLEHLVQVEPGSLAGLVLRGVVERSDPEGCVALADLCARVVAPGGRVVVISPEPAAWSRGELSIEADLAGRRPLAATTWDHLLAVRGFADIATAACGATYCVIGHRRR